MKKVCAIVAFALTAASVSAQSPNPRFGKTQVLTNVLSPDGTTIGVMYMRMNAEGKTPKVTFATYEKLQ